MDSRLSDDAHANIQIKEGVKSGVVVTRVDPSSNAAEKRIQPGEVIVEINQKTIATPPIAAAVKSLKDDGKKSALLLVANGQGDTHFVALTLD